MNARQLPKAKESLANYVNRQREALGLTRVVNSEIMTAPIPEIMAAIEVNR